jgi:hypothetical protein
MDLIRFGRPVLLKSFKAILPASIRADTFGQAPNTAYATRAFLRTALQKRPIYQNGDLLVHPA